MKFAVVANPQKYEVRDILNAALRWAKQNNTELLVSQDVCSHIQIEDTSALTVTKSDIESIEKAKLVLVMGGDGTILYTARISKDIGKPVLGINSGRLGFMANTQHENLEWALNCLISGNYSLDKRYLLKATDNTGNEFFALNDFVFTRKDTTSMVNIVAGYAGSLINTYWADGLIVASPTGSTAYNLSSAGPIVVPGTDVVLVTPINPHTLTTRPLVLRSDKPLQIRIEKQQAEILFSYDGELCEIHSLPFEVEIMQSDHTFNLIHLPGQDYFETLRNKLMWGLDNRRTKE